MQMYYHASLCFVGIFLTINKIKAIENNIIHADKHVTWDKKLAGCAFWSLQVSDIGTCARSCLRVKKCQSFNYELSTRYCDLNDQKHDKHGHRLRRAVGVIYSEIKAWPPELDPDCSSRPCSDEEVCLPQQVCELIRGTGVCTHSCMKFTTSLTTKGSGSASMPITPETTSVEPDTSSDSDTSTGLDTTSTDSNTSTGPDTSDSGTGSSEPGTGSSESGTGSSESARTPKQMSSDSTTASTSSTTSSTTPSTTTLSTTSTTTPSTRSTATTSSTQATTQPVVEGDIRVVNGADNSQGRLEIYLNEKWAPVSEDNWDWRATRTACGELGYSFGGSYHGHEAYGSGSGPAYKLKDIKCVDKNMQLRDCFASYDEDSDANKHLGITCFTENMEGPEFLRIKDDNDYTDGSNRVGLAQVKYQNKWGTICGENWSYTKMFCELKNSTWEKKGECKEECPIMASGPMWLSDVECKRGDEPHFFYCRNNGWGNIENKCDDDKALNVECGTN